MERLETFILENKFDEASHWLSSNPFDILNLNIEDIVNFLIIYDGIDCSKIFSI